jgi:hypothetical protein
MMPTPFDAWVLARIMADQPINGELADVSEALRPLTERLATTPPDGRLALLEGFQLSLADPAALVKALADAKPTEPPPDPANVPAEMPPDGPSPPGDCDGVDYPILPVEKLVQCVDRDPPNYGFILEDLGDRARVRFRPGEPGEATAILSKDDLRDPDGGPLTAESASSGWGPLRLEDLPPVEPFPVDVLPEPAARLVTEGAEAIGCPPDFLGLSCLAVAAGTIGRSVNLLIKPGYFASTVIFASNIGPPSDGKTPALKAVANAVRKISDWLAIEHAQALERWQAESDSQGPGGKKRKASPPKPRRIDIDDATMEVLPLILADNPRGLLMVRDELSALILGLNQYKAGGKGSDRANLLKIWSGDRIIKDRVGHEANIPIRCPHPSLSIVGGMTPDMLGELVDPKGRADGFIDRFLLAYPDPLPVADWSDRGIPEEVADDWRSLIARLWERPPDFKEGRSVPHVAYFTPEGKARWAEFYNAHSAEMEAPEFPPHLRGPWGKFREYAGRLALILTLMHHAADPTADPLIVPKVGPRRVEDTWRLIGYFKTHAYRVHAAIASGPSSGKTRVVKALIDWIRQGERASFTEHEFKQARRWVQHDDLARALSYLTGRNAIRPRSGPKTGPKGGRPPSPGYDVNPALAVTRNSQNPQFPGSAGEDAPGFEGSEGFE